MKLYLSVIKFNWLKILAYPIEIIAFFASRFIALGFLALFWYAIANSSSGSLDFRPLIAYFFLTAGIRELTFGNDSRFGRFIQQLIIRGEINNYFIKPIRTVPFLFCSFAGETWMSIAYALITMAIGLVILPPLSLINVIGFLIFLTLAFIISICFNVLIGIVSFYSPEAGGFRNAFNHVNKILSGSIVPLNLFPENVRWFLLFLPFSSVLFTPAYVLQNQLAWPELFSFLATAIFWSISLVGLTRYLWSRSVKNYEGIGI
jgi:ABC-2 type transport system permease protein